MTTLIIPEIRLQSPTPFGPSGEVVYKRTYARPLHDGTLEEWPQTVRRVVRGNLSLVYGEEANWSDEVREEFDHLVSLMEVFKIIPAGRHLWASGVKDRQLLSNCFVAGWGETLSEHFSFTFLRLMEGGGVGANYSSHHLAPFGAPQRRLRVHIVCDESHPDYEDMLAAGVLSNEYSAEWDGAYTVEDSREGWAAALTDLIDTYMTDDHVEHADRVYDVTNVRARGARLKTFGGTASGPLPFSHLLIRTSKVLNSNVSNRDDSIYQTPQLTPLEAMEIDHAIGECVVSGGVRRSARMSIVHWRDPYILFFIDAKSDVSKHWTTNISVEIDDEFIAAYHEGDHHARIVMDRIATGMLTNGEPGLWNSTLTNVGEVGRVIATNPCGEIGLEAWEPCNLGHVNLDAFADSDTDELAEAHELMTRFLIRATFGDMNDAKLATRVAANRRIGVGHLGVQGFLAKRGIRYSEAARHKGFEALLEDLYGVVRDEARNYAFQLRIPEPVKVTTVAPTGTIAKLPGATEGIHPIYSRFFIRRIRFNMTDPAQRETVEQAERDGFHIEPDRMDTSGNTWVVAYPTKDSLVEEVESRGLPASLVESQDELSVEQLLEFQKLYQRAWADNAVSFTINKVAAPHQQVAMEEGLPVPLPTGKDVEELSVALIAALPDLKGTTVMLDGSRPQSPYERIDRETYEAFANRIVSDGVDDECATGACPIR